MVLEERGTVMNSTNKKWERQEENGDKEGEVNKRAKIIDLITRDKPALLAH